MVKAPTLVATIIGWPKFDGRPMIVKAGSPRTTRLARSDPLRETVPDALVLDKIPLSTGA